MTKEELNEIMDKSNFFIDSENEYDMKILEAIEKQIPKKPAKMKLHEFCVDWVCQTCEIFHRTDRNMKFCSTCGQAIDWSE